AFAPALYAVEIPFHFAGGSVSSHHAFTLFLVTARPPAPGSAPAPLAVASLLPARRGEEHRSGHRWLPGRPGASRGTGPPRKPGRRPASPARGFEPRPPRRLSGPAGPGPAA